MTSLAPESAHVYLDHAATTPLSSAAAAAYAEQMMRVGNASSLHGPGRAARRVVEESREQVAEALGARPSEVIFTAGGTESDNLAIKGLFWARRTGHAERMRVLVSAIEHHAVLDPAFWLAEHAGAEVVQLPVDASGVLDLEALRAELDRDGEHTSLLSLMWANNEIGSVQPVREAAQLARSRGVPVHTDAVQAVGQVPVDFAASGVDALTVSGHKIGGPLGVGALLAGRGLDLMPVLHGGGQERAVRSGTLDVPAVRAFAVAVAESVAGREREAVRLAALRDELVRGILAAVPGASLRGADLAAEAAGGGPGRLPGNAHLTFDGCEGDSLLYLLDSAGVAVSTGSACQAGVPQPSHVLLALGLDEADARGALRFSLGAPTTAADVARVLEVLPGVVDRARAAGLASSMGGH